MEWNVLHGLQMVSGLVAGALIASLWQGLLLAVAIGICLRLIPRMGADTRFALWMAAFGVLAILPLAALYSAQTSTHGVVATRTPLHIDVRWSFLLSALWFAVSLYRGAILATNGWKLRGLWRRATSVNAREDVTSLLNQGRRHAELCLSDELDRPSLIGFFTPRIVVPTWLFKRLTDNELRQIVMHEMEHLRRGDDWINLVQKLGLVLFPLNPTLLWIERRLCLERELACDAGVIRATGAPKVYATCLTTLAERSLDRRVAALTLGAWERRSQLAERVYRILRREKMLSPVQTGAVMAISLLGLVAGAVELSRAPQLISFSAPAVAMTAQTEQSAVSQVVPAGGMQRVVYRDGVAGRPMQPHETLLRASMTDQNDAAASQAPTRHRRAKRTGNVSGASSARSAAAAAKNRAGQTHRLFVMSSWGSMDSAEEVSPPRMTLTVVEGNEAVPAVTRATFAAIPTSAGWLILQL